MDLYRLLFRALLGRRPAITAGELSVPGISGRVVVGRDEYGIPHVEADEDEDAWFGLGFCQGQDRAFQLETRVRAVRGTLAEMAGRPALAVDRLARRIGFREASLRQLPVLDADVRAIIEAFVRGVNAGLAAGGGKAHEFTLLRARPTSWDAADVLGVAKLMSFLLLGNWDVELSRLKVLREEGPEALAALEGGYPEDLMLTWPPGALAGPAADRLAEDIALFRAAAGGGGMSNAWAVAASRTASGLPLFANDPHLPADLPPAWYLAHLVTPRWALAGAALAGTPGFGVAHNGRVVWGVTVGFVDTTDLFLEEVSPDGRSVRLGNGFTPCELREEVIHVRGGPPVREQVLITPRGPIIGPALAGESGSLSLRATWLDARPAVGFFRAHLAGNIEDLRRHFEHWPLLDLNVVFADTEGNIGWQLIGEAPVRRKGWGTLPLPGWDPGCGWQEERVPFQQMPQGANPDQGFVVSANNKPVADGAGPFLGADWLTGYRVTRISESLAAGDGWDVPSTLALQMDLACLPWRRVRETVLAAPAGTERAATALGLLRSWDGQLSADSPAAAVFELFLMEMARRTSAAKAAHARDWALGKGFFDLVDPTTFADARVSHTVELLRLQPEGWFARPWPEEIADALASVVSYLRGKHGAKPERWAWGRVRPLMLVHPAGARRPLDRVFNLGPFPWGGDSNTVSQASTGPIDPTARPAVIASLRMVADVGNWDESSWSLPGGQSGNPLSPHYADLLPFWLRGEGVPIAWGREAVARAVRRRLVLSPPAGGDVRI